MKRAFIVAMLLLCPAIAGAFCGVYVGGAGTEIYNRVSQVAFVRIGDRTTLTLFNDVIGDTRDFALLIPVPEIIEESDLHTVSKDLFGQLDAYSSPRRVRYDCDDFAPRYEADTDGDTDADTDTDTDVDVQVEAQYVVGEYDVVILSSGDAGDLQTWLGNNQYVLPDDEQGILASYIEQGTYFLAAKVNEDADIAPGDHLSPLQMSYTAPMMSLPIRIGTLSAPPGETQDLIIYAITPYDDGMVGISNYPSAEIEESCMWLPEDGGENLNEEEFGRFYEGLLEDAYVDSEGAFWTVEYGWAGGKCDPCEGDPPSLEQLFTLGVPEEDLSSSFIDMYFTRLHMRYAPEEATQDLNLYLSGTQNATQQRYIDYLYELEDRFPICSTGFPLDPGDCDASGSGDVDDAPASRGCASRLAGVVLLTGLFWGRRRRR
ncbi:MAG: DUF2330 domain-containing protein [Myxococcota bacterium]